MDAWQMEMVTLKVAFQILNGEDKIPKDYTEAKGFCIFYLKIDFTRKTRWNKSGHLTNSTGEFSYAGVVSRESVQTALTYAVLNDLEVTMGDINCAYLSTPTSEWIKLGPEFGEDARKNALIVRTLYGEKHAGRDYWLYLQASTSKLGFESCYTDPDVLMQKATNKYVKDVYEYVLLYTDDCLVISNN